MDKDKIKITFLTLKKNKISDFARERNKMMSQLPSNTWVFFLDSDEKVTGIIGIDSNSDDTTNAYKILRKNYFLKQYVGSEYLVRLVKKDMGKWVRFVHEVWKSNGRVGILKKCYLFHDTAESLAVYLNKINNYSTLHAQQNKKDGKKPTLFKIIFYPLAKFIFTYVKSKHLVFSIMQSLHSFLSWTKLYFSQS